MNPFDNAAPCFPHASIVGDHSCDECRIKRAKRLSQDLVHVVTARSIRAKYKHFKTSASILWTVLQPFPVPPWNCGRPSKELKLCTTALSFYSPTPNISQRTFSRDLPCGRTTQPFLRWVSPILVIFQLQWQKSVIRTLFSVESWFRSACIHIECIPNTCCHEMMLVRQDLHCSSISSTWEPHGASFDSGIIHV